MESIYQIWRPPRGLFYVKKYNSQEAWIKAVNALRSLGHRTFASPYIGNQRGSEAFKLLNTLNNHLKKTNYGIN